MQPHYTTILILLAAPFLGFSQNQNFETKMALELNERVNFLHVDRQYELASDTIYYSYSGFLIDAHYDLTEKEGKEYVVVTYPGYDNKNKKKETITSDKNYSIDSVLQNGVRYPIRGTDDKILMIEKTVFDNLSKTTLYDTDIFTYKNFQVTTGLLTIPFKLRPEVDSVNFRMTTDVTIGPYFGLTKRLSKRNPHYLIIPATLGLTFINLTDNTTSTTLANENIEVVPGFSWSSGLITQLNKFTNWLCFRPRLCQ